MAGALIIAAQFVPEDLAWLDRLRRLHYPPERNQLQAHLTMFHALPPTAEQEARSTMSRLAKRRPPRARIEGLIDLGGGVAFRVVSADLEDIRQQLAEAFHGLLTLQDSSGWRPHVTIQNKVPPKVARALVSDLNRDFRQRILGIKGLALHRYLGGPWLELASYAFRG